MSGPKRHTKEEAWRLLRARVVAFENGCWLLPEGRAYVRVDGKLWRTGRLAYCMTKGPVYTIDVVRHSCDRENCINPDHLLKGTHADNTADKVSRGRHAHGETHPRSKLTESDVRAIRASTKSLTELSQEFGILRGSIANIRKHRTWRHVK